MCTVCYYRKISPLFSTNEVEICIGDLTYKACYNNNNVTLHSIPCRNINQRTTVKFTINYGMIIYTLQLGSGRWGYELALRYCLIYYVSCTTPKIFFFYHALHWIVLMLLVIFTKYFIAMKLLQIPLLVYELLNESNIACLFTVVCYYNQICSI